MMRRADIFLAGLIAILALGTACSDSSSGPISPAKRNDLPALIVSPIIHGEDGERIAAQVPARAGARVSASTTVSGMNAYVSLPPGSVPGGARAAIRDGIAGAVTTVSMVDGGFDPVAIAAGVGDTLFVQVARAGAATAVDGFDRVMANGAPHVVRASPARGAKDVALNATIVMVFSAPLDSATVDSSSFQLLQGTTRVPGTIRFADTLHLRVEFHPDTPLASEADYQLVVSQAIHDENGVSLDSSVTISFTTGNIAPPTNLVFSSVSVGFTHSCGVTTAGGAYCWGDNIAGQLGNGATFGISSTPVGVASDLTFASVSAGSDFTCALTTTGAAYCWGQGGQTGDSLGRNSPTPIPVAGGLTFASVSSGWYHSCGVTTTGAAYCWGESFYGELGGGSPVANGYAPQPVVGGLTFASVTVGGDLSCGVTTAGAAYCWGGNTLGELGTGSSTGPAQCADASVSYACSTIPVAVAGGLTFANLTAGTYHVCGATTSNVAYCWGDNLHDVLGDGTDNIAEMPDGPELCPDVGGVEEEWGPYDIPCSSVPRKVAEGGLGFASVSSGGQDWFACGIAATGRAYCWGVLPNPHNTTKPTAVPGGLTFKSISSGMHSSCGVTNDGVAYCWGANDYGELGDGTTTPRSAPVKVAGQP